MIWRLKCWLGYHEWEEAENLTLVDFDVFVEWGSGYPVSQYASVSSVSDEPVKKCKHCKVRK